MRRKYKQMFGEIIKDRMHGMMRVNINVMHACVIMSWAQENQRCFGNSMFATKPASSQINEDERGAQKATWRNQAATWRTKERNQSVPQLDERTSHRHFGAEKQQEAGYGAVKL